MQTHEKVVNTSKLERTASNPLTSTPVTKRSKLSSKKNRSQSPGQSNNGQDSVSPYHSPINSVVSRTPSQQSGTNGRSPLSNSTNYSSLQSTPNRGIFSSQEPHRDIVWDNTSPVNAKGRRGVPVGYANLKDLCKNWTHGDDGCHSQKLGTSDKWLSVNNGLGNVAALSIKDSNFRLPSKQEKQGSPLTRRKAAQPLKYLSTLLESVQKNNLKGPLKFEEAIAEEPKEIEVLAPNSDPAQKDGKSSSDDLWSDEDDSFLLKVSNCFDLLQTSPDKTSALVIPSTLSSENSTGSASNSASLSSVFGNDRSTKTSENGKSTNIKVPSSVIESLNETQVSSLRSGHTNSSIACTNFYDQRSSTRQQYTACKNRPGVLPSNLSRKQQSVPFLKTSPKNFDKGEGTDKMPTRTLLNPKIGMPGAWMSQVSNESSSCKSGSTQTIVKVRNESKKSSTIESGVQKSEVNFTKIVTRPSSLGNKATLISTLKSSKPILEMPKCASTVWKSQPEEEEDIDDDSIWDGVDTEIYSQENIELLDKIEREVEQVSQMIPKSTCIVPETQESNFSRGESKKSDTLEDSNKNANEMGSGTSLTTSESQASDSFKKQCSRKEINRKKAEALRRRRLREEAQCKIKLNITVHSK